MIHIWPAPPPKPEPAHDPTTAGVECTDHNHPCGSDTGHFQGRAHVKLDEAGKPLRGRP